MERVNDGMDWLDEVCLKMYTNALADAEGGDADAVLMPAIGYEAGFFVTRDEARAAEWRRRAAELGHEEGRAFPVWDKAGGEEQTNRPGGAKCAGYPDPAAPRKRARRVGAIGRVPMHAFSCGMRRAAAHFYGGGINPR